MSNIVIYAVIKVKHFFSYFIEQIRTQYVKKLDSFNSELKKFGEKLYGRLKRSFLFFSILHAF